jgi:UDP-N-acetylglucosamine--N-acetylmuramyl-(pentapeptide) pyrophosphoryl-undecaprenol N-acetylglucosamine transferase
VVIGRRKVTALSYPVYPAACDPLILFSKLDTSENFYTSFQFLIFFSLRLCVFAFMMLFFVGWFMSKKVLISVGGTGGHVFPAIALAQQLQQCDPNCQILFVGGKLSENRFFKGHPFECRDVICGSIKKKNPWHLSKSFFNILLQGAWQSLRLIKEYQPDLIVGFGSFYTFPTLVAATVCRKRVMLHEANSIPGKVNRLLSKYVEVTGIHFPETAQYIKGTSVEVGMPLREGFVKSAEKRLEGYQYFQLDPYKRTILVFGGSQGAKALNQLLARAFGSLNLQEKIQIVHFTGHADQSQDLREFYAKRGFKACVKDFETRMDLAWNIADCLISRAGAATVAEQMEFEVPGILVPYPYATDRHQDHNANFMVKSVGGAVCYQESHLNPQILAKAVQDLLEGDVLKAMSENIQNYKRNKRNKDLCGLVQELLNKQK